MKIYLAGPDVFRPDAVQYGDTLKHWCARHGFTGLYPLDNTLAGEPHEPHGPQAAAFLYRANLALIDDADLVMANLNPFRGSEPDSGTAFEVGYAHARGKPVWAYTAQSAPLAEQLLGHPADLQARYVDRHGYAIENFGLALNLMLACSVTLVVGDARNCLEHIARQFSTPSAVPARHD